MTDVFAPTALAAARAELASLEDHELDQIVRSNRPVAEVVADCRRRRLTLEAYIADLESGACARRPGRVMPGWKAVAAHHQLPANRCWRCWTESKSLERAHLVCRGLDGLDAVQNLALLCGPCHAEMPEHSAGMEERARRYAFKFVWALDPPGP